MQSLPLTPNRKQAEWSMIQLFAQNNNFLQKFIQNLKQQIRHKTTQEENDKNKKRVTVMTARN